MWNDKRSIALSKLCILLFMGLTVCLVVTAPWLVRWFLRFSLSGTLAFFLSTIYTGCIPASILLYNLFRLLHRIEAGQVFVAENVDGLRRISWSCIMGAGICFVSGFYYFPWILVAVAAAFMGLVVRVIKNVVAQAVALQNEVDYTI